MAGREQPDSEHARSWARTSAGTIKIANGSDGIVIDSSSQNTVGGTISGTVSNGTVVGVGLVLVSGNYLAMAS